MPQLMAMPTVPTTCQANNSRVVELKENFQKKNQYVKVCSVMTFVVAGRIFANHSAIFTNLKVLSINQRKLFGTTISRIYFSPYRRNLVSFCHLYLSIFRRDFQWLFLCFEILLCYLMAIGMKLLFIEYVNLPLWNHCRYLL